MFKVRPAVLGLALFAAIGAPADATTGSALQNESPQPTVSATTASRVSPEQEWKGLALAAGLNSPLTPKEQQCYRDLSSCYSQLTANESPSVYYTTRAYFHIAEQTVKGIADPRMFPNRIKAYYDAKFITADEQAIIKKALDVAIHAMLDDH